MTCSLEAYFDRIVWINLDRRVDRRRVIDDEMDRLHVDRHCRIPGVDNRENGYVGCMDSHRLLWRRIAAGEFGDRVLVLEDDFVTLTVDVLHSGGYRDDHPVMTNFLRLPWRPVFDALPHLAVNERWDAAVKHLPPMWDLLYLGGQYQCDPIGRWSPFCIRNAGMLGTLAYGIMREMASMLTVELDQRCPVGVNPGPVDLVLTSFAKKRLSYTLTPRFFIPRPGNKSDISQETEGFPFAYTDEHHEWMV